MDKFGRAGKSLTFKPRYLGTNTGTTLDEMVNPAAQFVAGMVGFKDPATGLIRAAIGDAINQEDLLGQAYGFIGLTKFDRTALRMINDPIVSPALPTETAKLSKTNVFSGASPVVWSQPIIYNDTQSKFLTTVAVTTIIADVNTDLTRGLLAALPGAALVGGGTVAAGDLLLVSYYYRPLQDDLSPIGLDETAPNGAVTIWKFDGQFEVSVYEPAAKAAPGGADTPGLPAVNDPLYVSANGLLTAHPRDAASWVIAICRRAPSFSNPFMMFDCLI